MSRATSGDHEPGPQRGVEHDNTETALTTQQIRRKAASGVLYVGLRSFAVRGLGLLGSLVLARLLVPEDFGVLAFGQTLITFGSFFADAGIAAGLIRRNQAATRYELRTVLGFQVLVASTLALAVAVVAVPSGRSGQVSALMAASVVLVTYRVPASLVLERRLDYRTLATVEVVEGLVFVVWSIVSVFLGAGVWGVASAHVARAAVGSALMIGRSPVRVLRPGLHLSIVRELLGYGLVVQAGGLVNLVRGQGINLLTAALAGLPALGLYSLADRVMQLPWLVFESILRVTFPAMARLISAGENPKADLARGLKLLVVAVGPLLALVAATSPVLVPVLFGAQWTRAADALPFIALALLVAGPIIAVGNGYLYAVGDAKKILVANAAHFVAWCCVAVPLLPAFGVAAVGAGLLAGFVVEGLLLARAVRLRTGLRCYRITAVPSLLVLPAAGVGLALARSLRPSLLAVLAVGTLTAALLAAGLLFGARTTVQEALAVLRTLTSRDKDTAPAQDRPSG